MCRTWRHGKTRMSLLTSRWHYLYPYTTSYTYYWESIFVLRFIFLGRIQMVNSEGWRKKMPYLILLLWIPCTFLVLASFTYSLFIQYISEFLFIFNLLNLSYHFLCYKQMYTCFKAWSVFHIELLASEIITFLNLSYKKKCWGTQSELINILCKCNKIISLSLWNGR
jgi:hypothetical protein